MNKLMDGLEIDKNLSQLIISLAMITAVIVALIVTNDFNVMFFLIMPITLKLID